MYDYKRLRELVDGTKAEMRLFIKDKGPMRLKQDIDRMVKNAEHPDKTNLCKMSNFDIFITFLNLLNDDVFTYDETMENVLPIKNAINSWTYDSVGIDLVRMQEQTNDDGSLKDFRYMETFTKLGLTPIFIEYKMRLVYICMNEFLKLKKEILNQDKFTRKIPYTRRLVFMQNQYKQSPFSNYVNVAKQYIETQMKKYDERHDQAEVRLKWTKKFEELLEEDKLDDITEIPIEWHQYLDPRILEELYDHVQSNLLKKYTDLEKRETEIKKALNASPLINFLYSNGLNPSSLPQDRLVTLNEIPNILERINFFAELNIPINNILTVYYKYLVALTDEKLNTLTLLINKKVLSKETIKDNPSIIDSNYRRVIVNYDILKDIVDTNSVFYSDKILLSDPKEISRILAILKEYKLSINNYLFLLSNIKYLNIYDLMLENDIPEYLLISICKTSNPLNTIKRILIYKNIDEPYTTSNGMLRKDIILETKFICDDNNLDEYLPNYVSDLGIVEIEGTNPGETKTNEVITLLDEEHKVEDVYVFGQTSISRPKFIRNFAEVSYNSAYLVPCIVSNSILNESEYYNLMKELKSKEMKK